MAVVEYVDSEGRKRYADENSKAYEKHLKSTKSEDASRVKSDRVEQPKPALKIEPKPETKG